MKTMLDKIVGCFSFVLDVVVSTPLAAIAYIISCIKHESDEAFYRRAFRMLPIFVKDDLTEDDFVYMCRTKYFEK